MAAWKGCFLAALTVVRLVVALVLAKAAARALGNKYELTKTQI